MRNTVTTEHRGRRRWVALALCLLASAALAEEPEPVAVPAEAVQNLLDFASLPERNVAFIVEEDPASVYNAVHQLLLELDYQVLGEPSQRGDLLGPYLSQRRYRHGQLAEIVAVRLQDSAGGTDLTIRALFVTVAPEVAVDQSGRKPSRGVRHFPELYDAKRIFTNQTTFHRVVDLLDQAQANLAAGIVLDQTQQQLRLAEAATLSTSAVGRRTRELLGAVNEEVNRREWLQKTADTLRAKIRRAMADRDPLAAWLASDELVHVLLANNVPRADALFVEALTAQERARRLLAQRGRLIAFHPHFGPGTGNEVVVGFTVLNVTNRPIGSFDAAVDLLDANGRPLVGRPQPARPAHIKPAQPIPPGGTYTAALTVAFDAPVQPSQATVRISRVAR